MKDIISIKEKRIMIDGHLQFNIKGLSSYQEVTLQAEAQDDIGRTWKSFGIFIADENGNIELDKSSPIKGSYMNCSPEGLLWSMTPENNNELPLFLKTTLKPFKITLRLISEEVVLDEKIIQMDFLDPNTEMVTIENEIIGKYFRPSNKTNLPAILVLGGSSGGFIWSEQVASVLSSRGYAALALNYFDYQSTYGVPNQLIEIPLEYSLKALDWLRNRPEVNTNKIGIIGISKGAELSLLIASISSYSLAGVIAYSPSSHIFEGIAMGEHPKKSSWSFNGEPMNFIRYPEDTSFNMNMDSATLLEIHARALRQASPQQKEESRIKVEKINCPILMISGEKDHTWPSKEMCDSIKRTLDMKSYSYKHEHLNFSEMGHAFFVPNIPPIVDSCKVMPADVSRANRVAWDKSVEFLDINLKTN
ncbi:acyl-CoA thioesterase/bile acid-CoA:amino acid N-acyltransferase family protein [Geosporobacter ferrireducens]|uniref:Acyl-CoA thioesterase n=1 Tax=Geosporobacter ferrireducens TaxID=1424294 RepID=A0A1D8GI43_9FIRM|nr:acyl-CoA thioesterase/bile acid-CoA:amino acid N-acyltransferase family protein [Geosporobacter ferrireducens]AOT70593.1 hypothetical protein Gferi_14040 [Geosporobacter ferrireducens]MTI57385.1 hypothetical protein [Geosporobacter ferrireducens]